MCVYSWWLPSLQGSDVNGCSSDTCLTFPTGILTWSYTITISPQKNLSSHFVLKWWFGTKRKSVLLYHSIVKMLLKYWFVNNVWRVSIIFSTKEDLCLLTTLLINVHSIIQWQQRSNTIVDQIVSLKRRKQSSKHFGWTFSLKLIKKINSKVIDDSNYYMNLLRVTVV